ncbi:MAG: hypothetical protein L3J25_03145 [Flavobacteriaceae bacterium]|nr:hypothetical protein [Flavobacteriaceae bacterium]
MKLLFKFLTITFFALLFFTSCQDEVIESTQINEQQLLVANSALAGLVQATSARDGSVDNILDNANCLSINLPVTVIVNDITITINTLEDLELIEDIFEEFENDDDVLELLFPITIVLNNHEEIVINNQNELDAFIDQCTDDSDDDIECIDFLYPISFSIFNSDFQIIETVVIENDSQLYEFLENLEDNNSGAILASLNFPVTMVYANGETVEVNSNQELEEVLNDANVDCEDEEACSEEVVKMYLQECYWNIESYNDNNDLEHYDLYFFEDGLFKVKEDGTIVATGTWNTSLGDSGVILHISELTTPLVDVLSGDWLVVECDDDEFELEKLATSANEAIHIVIEQECDDDLDCSAQEVKSFLEECQWYADSNLFSNIPVGAFYFEDDNVLIVEDSNTNEEVEGTWDVELTDEGIFLVIDLPEPFDIISLRWKVYECGEHRIKVINGDSYIIFERECPFECFEYATLTECDGETDDDSAIFDLTTAFEDCAVPAIYSLTYYESSEDAANGVNQIENPSEYANTSNPQTVYLKIENINNGNFELFEIQLEVEYCNQNCTEQEVDAYLLECIWNVVSFNGDDHLMGYDLEFNINEEITITDSVTTDTFTGFWSTSQTNEGVLIQFANINGPNIQALNGDWIVVSCESGRLELQNNSNETMILEQDCD